MFKPRQILILIAVLILICLTVSLLKNDFVSFILPGWHTTIYPPYFVISCISLSLAWIFAILLIWKGYLALKKK